MNKALRAQGLTFCALSAVVALSALLSPPLEERVELALISGLILTLGVPHGALDTIFARQVYRLRSPGAWLSAALLYAVLAALVVGVWWISPVVFLAGFLLVSIAHFSGDLASGVSTLTRVLYAGAVIVLPCLRFEADVARQFGFLAGPGSGVSLAAALSVLAWPWLACSLAAAAFALRRNTMAGAELLAVILLAVFASPLVGFAVFFCGMHSARHVIRTYHYANRSSLRLLLTAALVPMLLVVLAAITGWVFLDHSAPSRGVAQFLFIGLAALTVPHMLLVERVRLSGWRLGAAAG
ncbi:Brp/Blh family beta-carotene 15,15'-dioxygenase [Gemmatimonas sp.]|uniref:Brp/Blh family beta-carotene 15,15'-dioxygenase n=1 Tax=Gemmatimonas sp. TaxID=1962908 RepID=UPI003568DCD1